ncbi:MAG: DNA recombination protein RmuC [Clostridia bacterium]|nr:DNA recombination protein RmuC [Clostridia bacterium]
MEKVLLIIAVVLIAISVCLSVITLALSKRRRNGGEKGADVLGEIENLNNNLNEVKNLINEHTTKEREILSTNLTSVVNASNGGLVPMLAEYMKSFKDTLGENLNTTKETLEEIRREMKEATVQMSRSTDEALGSLKKDTQEALDRMSKSTENSLDRIGNSLKDSLKELRDDNKTQLESVQRSNEAQLEKMRQTVDEKLNETLDKRIKNAFEMVSNSLSQVQQGFGEMRELTGKVSNLNKMFTNVKTRGGWGEVALESLLDQILSPEQYHCQYRLDSKSREMVDFAIVMPGQGDTVYLPIDSKFPLDKYIALVEISESGDAEKTESARKELFNTVKEEAKSISKKYIITGVTTRYAIMYLPSEGLYAEIAKNSALTAHIQNEYHVTVCGPTTITALLNSLQMGFTTLKIQERSSEIAKALQDFQKDFTKYTNLVSSIKKNANTMVNTIGEVEKRNELITKRLAKVSSGISQDEEQKMIASDIAIVESDTNGEEG